MIFPYYANDGVVEYKGNPQSSDMWHTHWCILYRKCQILYCQQSNSSKKRKTTLEHLFRSNQMLLSHFTWAGYFDNRNIKNPCLITRRCNKIKNNNRAIVKEYTNQINEHI